MVIEIKEASKLLEFVKGMSPEVDEGIVVNLHRHDNWNGPCFSWASFNTRFFTQAGI
ncbi:MAG: hypothetical protein ACNYVW_03815 [Methanosarcinales archaeon]